MTSTKTMRVNLLFAAATLIIGCGTPLVEAEPTPVPGSTVVYLVRHAEKQRLSRLELDPSISSVGQERARALASRLGAAGITAIVITQFKRTQETAEPLASAIGVTPEIVAAGRQGDTDSAVAAVFRHRGKKVLIVGHSKTIPPIIKALGGPKLPDLCENQYSDLFIMHLPPSGTPQLVRQHYGSGDPPRELACTDM